MFDIYRQSLQYLFYIVHLLRISNAIEKGTSGILAATALLVHLKPPVRDFQTVITRRYS